MYVLWKKSENFEFDVCLIMKKIFVFIFIEKERRSERERKSEREREKDREIERDIEWEKKERYCN